MTTYKNLQHVRTDSAGIGLFYNPDAKYPNSKYVVVYPEFNGILTPPEELPFQSGQMAKVGINGVTNDLLIHALIHRLEQCMAGGDKTARIRELHKHLRRAGNLFEKREK